MDLGAGNYPKLVALLQQIAGTLANRSQTLVSAASMKLDDVGLPVLDWQERSDWVNVKTRCGAVGDGRHDDTTAINHCLTLVPAGAWSSAVPGMTLYLPPGTYRLTSTLVAGTRNMSAVPPSSQGWIGGGIVGHGRETKLVWDGPAGGQMLHAHGVAYFRIQGFHLIGRGVAGIGIYHQTDSLFQTEVLHINLRLSGFTVAALSISLKLPDYKGGGGKEGSAIASSEVLYRNCIFEDSKVGILLNFFNDYVSSTTACKRPFSLGCVPHICGNHSRTTRSMGACGATIASLSTRAQASHTSETAALSPALCVTGLSGTTSSSIRHIAWSPSAHDSSCAAS